MRLRLCNALVKGLVAPKSRRSEKFRKEGCSLHRFTLLKEAEVHFV